ncbi:203_t:CDS:2 [Entrophospora sp. SA101]|nr:203_t:CDS:2 [Entrophospora sp. SA101]
MEEEPSVTIIRESSAAHILKKNKVKGGSKKSGRMILVDKNRFPKYFYVRENVK